MSDDGRRHLTPSRQDVTGSRDKSELGPGVSSWVGFGGAIWKFQEPCWGLGSSEGSW